MEAVRAPMVAKRSARSERTQASSQARALIVTGPEDLRARFAAHATADLVTDLASLRPRPGAVIGYHTRIALRELGRRAEFLDSQIVSLDALIVPLITGHAPGLLALHGVGPDTAALLLVAAGDHPERLRSEAAWAGLCAAAPIPASSGKTKRHRLNPAADRQANHALWRIVITRMSNHPPTRAYVERRTAEGLSKTEIMRCLKRGHVTWQLSGDKPSDSAPGLEHQPGRARRPGRGRSSASALLITDHGDWPAADVIAGRSRSEAEFPLSADESLHAVSCSSDVPLDRADVRVHVLTCVMALQIAHLMRLQRPARRAAHVSPRAPDPARRHRRGHLDLPRRTRPGSEARRMLTETTRTQDKLDPGLPADRKSPLPLGHRRQRRL